MVTHKLSTVAALGCFVLATAACGSGSPPRVGGAAESVTTPATAPDTTPASAPDTTPDTTPVSTPPADVSWTQQDLGAPMSDASLSSAVHDGITVMLYVGPEAAPRSFVSVDGAPFTSHDLDPAGLGAATLVRVTSTSTGFLAIGGEDTTFVTSVWTSSDGIVWNRVAAHGLELPAAIGALVATPDGWYAAGALRDVTTPSEGGFQAAMWRSVDGVAWEPVALPGADPGSYVAGMVATDTALLAVVARPGGSTLLRSGDGGVTWQPAAVEAPDGVELGQISGLGSTGATIVALATIDGGDIRPAAFALRSDDDGRTYLAASIAESGPGALVPYGNTITAAGDAFWVSLRREYGFTDSDICYQDLARCRRASDPVLLRSADGRSWSSVDLQPLSSAPYAGIVGVVDVPGGVVAVTATDRLTAATWPTLSAPPLLAPEPPQPGLDTPLVRFDGTLAVGVRARFPLLLHCGMDVLANFNDVWWILDPATATYRPETGAGDVPPADWPVAQQTVYGFVTLIDATTIEYSLPSGVVVGVYHPADITPPGCA